MVPPDKNPNNPDQFKRPAAVSRRKFLTNALKTVSRLGLMAWGGNLAFSGLPMGFRTGTAEAGLLVSSSTKQLIRNAPVAWYWISSDADGVDCLRCHSPDDKVSGRRYVHGKAFVQCRLCAQECIIGPGERGQCRTRINADGQLRSLVYGHPVSVHVDPIEKKPFYHFLPGAPAFSLATVGCPLHCKFCQNWEISQARPEDYPTRFVPPEAVVRGAGKRQASVIAFTYNEPTVFAEYLLDIARMGRKQNLRSVLVSCGFMNPEPLNDMCEVLDAIKIDLKGFDRGFYRKVCNAELDPVLRSIRQIARRGVHLELVNLVVPTLNDSEAMLNRLAEWVAGELGPDVPVHFTRFHPDYQMLNLPPTPTATLERAYEIARSRGIRYPYVGNVPGHPGNHTYCPSCGKAVIRRTGFFVTEQHLKKGRCAFCGESVAGVWA